MAYLYSMPSDWLAFSAAYQFERFVRDPQAQNEDVLARSTTHKVPLEARFFFPSGLFARAKGTYFSQNGRFGSASGTVIPGSYSFWTVDVSLGYRFPNQRGLASIEMRNLFDERFNFQDSDPTNSVVPRERYSLPGLQLHSRVMWIQKTGKRTSCMLCIKTSPNILLTFNV